MSRFKPTDLLDRTFEVGITLKGLDGVLEVVGGLLLLVVSPATIDQLTRTVTQHELSEDPHDFIATHLLNAANGLTGSSVRFGAIYLLLHGVVKIVLVAALLRNQLWAYPWMIAFLGAFIAYQAPDDVCALDRAGRAYGLRRLRGLAHLSGVPQTAVRLAWHSTPGPRPVKGGRPRRPPPLSWSIGYALQTWPTT